MNRSLFAALAVAVLIALAAFFIFQDGDDALVDEGSVPVNRADSGATGNAAEDSTDTGNATKAAAPASGGQTATATSEQPSGDPAKPADSTNVTNQASETVKKAAADVADKASDAASDAANTARETVDKAVDRVTGALTDDASGKAGDARTEAEGRTDQPESGGGNNGKSETTTAAAEDDGRKVAVLDKDARSGSTTGAADEKAPDPQAGATEAPAVAALPALRAPSFDVVRISSRDCTAVLAGRSEPFSTVTLLGNGSPLATLQADAAGEWAHLVLEPLAPGAVTLSLQAEREGRRGASEEDVVLIVPDCDEPGQNDTAVAVLAPKTGGTTRILQEPAPDGDGTRPGGLNVGKVDYDDQGKVSVTGSSDPDREVRAYVDGKFVGRAEVDDNGNWTVIPEGEISPGLHVLRVDQVNKDGVVLARVELPFARATPGELELAEDQVIVQPGNSLWRIARRTYGSGINYSVIYRANRDLIRDPDLIYPGQVFRLPSVDETTAN